MMIKVKLKGDVIKEYEAGTTIADVAKSLGAGLFKAACAGKVNGELRDLRTELGEDCELSILTFDDEEGKKAYWHTTSHVLAQAVLRIIPDAKFAIGPAIENGFYYDFDLKKPLTPEDLTLIEAEMKKVIKENLPIERFTLPVEDALRLMEEYGQPYKVELIREHADKGEAISFYKQGDFTDLCAGPHLLSTGALKAVKLTNATGAYWRGDSANTMLQRIYGISFPKASLLEEYLIRVEEAKKRDHNVIGRQLHFFTTNELVGQGLPLLMPKGARVIQTLQRFVEDEEERRGYLLTKTPLMAKSDLYKLSGHWDHYKDGMFVLGDEEKEDEIFALRPMTCPFQYMIYKADMHSYRDLPLRYGETSTLFRNESSGEMHGLIRVRQFTISEGHLICTPEQLEEEFAGVVDLVKYMMRTLGIEEDISYRLSKWDPAKTEKYIGTPEMWEETQQDMKNILLKLGIEHTEADDEAAFYGPKLDIQMKNVHGKEDTIITIQIDHSLAERFDMTYIDAAGERKYPYIIHRTSIGCYERTLAMLIEKYAGALPMWLLSEQVRILPISDRFQENAQEIRAKLRAAGIKAEVDTRSEKIGYKIREAQMEKIPYMLLVGEKELESGTVSVRSRKDGDLGSRTLEEFIQTAREQIEKRALD